MQSTESKRHCISSLRRRTCAKKPIRTDDSTSRTCFSCLPMLICAPQTNNLLQQSPKCLHTAARAFQIQVLADMYCYVAPMHTCVSFNMLCIC